MRIIVKFLDILFFSIFAFIFLLFSGFFILLGGLRRQRKHSRLRRKIVYLVSGSIDAEKTRNKFSNIKEGIISDFGGYFEQVYILYFRATKYREMQISDYHTLIDFSADFTGTLERLGFHLVSLSLDEISVLWNIRKLITSKGISFIEATDPYISGANALLLSRLCGVPYGILVCRDYDFDYQRIGKLAFDFFRFRWLEKAIEKVVFRSADLVIGTQQFYTKYALKNMAVPARTFASIITVGKQFYGEPRQRKNLKPNLDLSDKRILLYVGRISADKYVEDLVRCLSIVCEQRSDVCLLIAGDGPLRGHLEALANQLGVNDRVYLLGMYPPDELPNLMSTADIILGPHMGYTLLEAALSGTPIVAYNWEWHPEVITNMQTGVLVDFGDYKGMAQAVLMLLKDSETATKLAQNARRYALKNHSQTAMFHVMRNYYEQMYRNSWKGTIEK